MRKDKEEAKQLRLGGLSYAEIERKLKIPRSTLSEWFAGETWSKDIRKKLTEAAKVQNRINIRKLDAIRGVHLARVYEEARKEAIEEFRALKYNPLFIAGLMLYWGEGDKLSPGNTRLINTDPNLVKLFLTFLTHVCQIPQEKIRASLLIYPDLHDEECRKYWSEHLDFPLSNFSKSTTIVGRHQTKRIKYGMCIISVSSTYFKVKIREWLVSLPRELMSSQYYASIDSDAGMV